jgi:DNA-binding NtrC family response regulator
MTRIGEVAADAHEWRGRLIADRFVGDARGVTIDLATGRRVELMIMAAGSSTEMARWGARCGFFAGIEHRYLARLVDYGALGGTRRFEAWACDGPWRGARGAAAQAQARSAAFLRACGRAPGALDALCLRVCGARPVVLPDAAAGYEAPADSRRPDITRDVLGLCSIGRPLLSAVGEMFSRGRRAFALAVSGPRDVGIDGVVSDLARTARLHGYVPLGARFARSPLATPAHGRTIFLIAGSDGEGWIEFLQLLTRSPGAHILLFAGAAPTGVCALRLTAVGADVLTRAVLPVDLPPPLQVLVRRLAVRARGSPVRFASLLWERPVMRHPEDRPSASRAAEPAVCYGEPAEDVSTSDGTAHGGVWPASGGLPAIRRRTAAALESLGRGRHARADRALRQAIAAFTRRGADRDATHAALDLAASLLKRGRPQDAGALLADARTTGARAADEIALLRLAMLSGHAAIDNARLDEAEALLSGAMAAAEGLKQYPAERAARLGLARCLFWRGQFEKGWQLLDAIDPRAPDDRESVELAAERSRLSIGRGDLESGVSAAAAALLRADRLGGPALHAQAACAAAFAQLNAGDPESARAMVARCVGAARLAHDPLLALRARLVGAECDRRQGRRGPGITLIRRIRRMSRAPLPRVLSARTDLLADLLTGATGVEPHDVAAQHVRSTGLGGLALFAPPRPSQGPGLTVVRDLVDILQCCHVAADDAGVLAALCARLRVALDAAAVGFFAGGGTTPVPSATDGGRLEPGIAARVLDVDQPIAPRQVDGRIEAGAPVRYGGRRIGALVARWTLASTVAEREALALLATAAAAAAPALAAVLAKRQAPALAITSHLLGTSQAIVNVRDAVERAAPAPFAVLIQGESGSGKELVARALHRQGPRKDRPFCTLNCAALPDDLVESELFGHARGAFTGAMADRPGVFEEAHTGTLFLDEVGELSLRAQAKVLRTIQDGELRRVGENLGRRVDVRLISATNRDLRQEVADGRFRLDLLYRLDVIRITIPPLRERRDDIPLLAEHLWSDATGRLGSRAMLGAAALACLARYDWPGNVRELQNVLAALAVRSPRRGIVGPSALPPPFDRAQPETTWRLNEARRTFDSRFIRAALARAGGHRGRAAEELGVSRQGLSKLMSRLGIAAGPDEPADRDL